MLANTFMRGPYIVTGQPHAHHKFTKGAFQIHKHFGKSFRVANVVTGKLASAEFKTMQEALFHRDLLVEANKCDTLAYGLYCDLMAHAKMA